MLPPLIGDMVYWYPEGDLHGSPHPAFVTAVGQDSVTLNIMGPDIRTFHVQDGVHHVTSDYAKKPEVKDSGLWDFAPQIRAVQKLLEAKQSDSQQAQKKGA